jgi:hypothetical protein
VHIQREIKAIYSQDERLRADGMVRGECDC